jgi:hypothetical protein
VIRAGFQRNGIGEKLTQLRYTTQARDVSAFQKAPPLYLIGMAASPIHIHRADGLCVLLSRSCFRHQSAGQEKCFYLTSPFIEPALQQPARVYRIDRITPFLLLVACFLMVRAQ